MCLLLKKDVRKNAPGKKKPQKKYPVKIVPRKYAPKKIYPDICFIKFLLLLTSSYGCSF